MSKLAIVQVGESLPFSFDRGDETTDGFICTISVKQRPSDTATISRVVPLDSNGKWSGFLTSAEMTTIGAVGISLWYLTAALVNATTGEKEELPERFSISTSWT